MQPSSRLKVGGRWGLDVLRTCVAAAPVTKSMSTCGEGLLEHRARVERRAANGDEVPAFAEILPTHTSVGLEATAGKDD